MTERGKQVARAYNIIADRWVGAYSPPLHTLQPQNTQEASQTRVFAQQPQGGQSPVKHRGTFVHPSIHPSVCLSIPPRPCVLQDFVPFGATAQKLKRQYPTETDARPL